MPNSKAPILNNFFQKNNIIFCYTFPEIILAERYPTWLYLAKIFLNTYESGLSSFSF